MAEDDESREFSPEESVYELEPFVLPAGRLSSSEGTEASPKTIEADEQGKLPDLGSDSLVDGLLQEDDIEAENPDLGESDFSATNSLYEMQPFVLPEQLTKPPAAEPAQLEPEEEDQVILNYRKMADEREKQARKDPLIDSLLSNRYRITGLVGEGNMAIVYKAVDSTTGEVVAVKSYLPDASESEKKRFHQEIKTHSKLTHKNIVRYIDFVVDENERAFLVMENVKGISLADILKVHGPIQHEETIWLVLTQICEALNYAHEQGTIHRDLKSGNVVLSQKGDDEIEVKLLDFGIARTDEGKDASLTQEGKTIGSPYYMSPEQCYGFELSPVSDVYALGLLTYEIVSGNCAYPYDNLMQVVKAHCDPRVMPPSLANAAPQFALVGEFDTIIQRALATDPSERTPSAAQFQNELNDWIRSARLGEQSRREEPRPVDQAGREPDQPPSTQLNKPALVIGVALAVLFVVVSTTAYWIANPQQLMELRGLFL